MANNQQLAFDNFASGSLAAGWSANSFGAFATIGGSSGNFFAEPPNTTTAGAQIWTALTWPNDQISEVTIKAIPSSSSNFIVLMLRWQSASVTSGYALFLSSNALTINRYNAGTGTTLALMTIAPAAGDVWSAQIAGNCITLYQNGKLITYVYDASASAWASGSPGFWVSDTAPTTNAHVSAWRGYSFQQQDGIWTKQQIIISPNASDLAGTGELGPQNPSIIFEGNSQLGLGAGNVYKMWFTALGVNNSPGHVGYAEATSLYGPWTRRGTDVIIATGVGTTPFVTKVGSTYYCFDGEGTVQLWTSSDGVTWSLSNANIFTKTNCIYFAPLIQLNGTWYAFYSSFTSFPALTNYATAPAITGPWTDQGNIPALNNLYGILQLHQVGSTFYAWGQSVNPGAQSSKPGIDPGEGLRMQCPAASFPTGWTKSTNSVHHSHMIEAVNGVNAGCFPQLVMDLNGKATMIYGVDQDDAISTSKSIFQLAIAQAPAPIASIVTQPENGLAQTDSDSFARSAGGLGAGWSTPSGRTGLQIASSGIVEAGVTGANCTQYRNGAFGTSQYSSVKISALASNAYLAAPTVYQQSNGLNCYLASVLGALGTQHVNAATIQKLVNGVETAIGPTVTYTPNANDVFTLAVSTGSDGFNVLSLYQNGYMLLQVQDYSNSFTSGQPGILMFATTTLASAQVTAWAGGNANVLPNFVTAYSVPDCRVAPFGPNGSRNVNNTLIYDVQTSDNPGVPSKDSRVAGAPIASGTYPQNSRTPGTYGPGE